MFKLAISPNVIRTTLALHNIFDYIEESVLQERHTSKVQNT